MAARWLLLAALCLVGVTAQKAKFKSCKPQRTVQEWFRHGVNERTLDFAAQSVQDGLSQFTQSLYLHMAEKNEGGNFVFSPLSIHSAMSMLYLGTTNNSDTFQEIGRALGNIQSQTILKLGYYNVVNTYCNEANFLYGNSFWVKDGFPVKPDFLKTVEDNMDSDVENIDFGQRDSAATVNEWVRKKTGGKIPNLVDSFSPQTKLFIANALYFKEKWKVPFSRAHAQRFQTPNGEKDRVPMIDLTSDLIRYEEIRMDREIVEVITIPYNNELFEMTIYLPGKRNGMARLEAFMKLSRDSDQTSKHALYFNLFDEKSRTQPDEYIDEVYLKMPTFKIKTDLDAVEPLQELGVEKVFTTAAELGGITDQGGLAVSRIIHKALIEVTKEGTEGAAATGIEIALFSASFGDEKEVYVERPFIFVVTDKKNKIPVLVGKINDPTKI